MIILDYKRRNAGKGGKFLVNIHNINPVPPVEITKF